MATFDSMNRRQPSSPPPPPQPQPKSTMFVPRRKNPKQERFGLLLPQIILSKNNGAGSRGGGILGCDGNHYSCITRIKKLMLILVGECAFYVAGCLKSISSIPRLTVIVSFLISSSLISCISPFVKNAYNLPRPNLVHAMVLGRTGYEQSAAAAATTWDNHPQQCAAAATTTRVFANCSNIRRSSRRRR